MASCLCCRFCLHLSWQQKLFPVFSIFSILFFFLLSLSYTFSLPTEKMKGFIAGSHGDAFSPGTAQKSSSYISPPCPMRGGRSLTALPWCPGLGYHPAHPLPTITLSVTGLLLWPLQGLCSEQGMVGGQVTKSLPGVCLSWRT